VPFETTKIADAIDRAFRAAHGDSNAHVADELANAVALTLARGAESDVRTPTVGEVDTMVERALVETGHREVASAYAAARAARAQMRAQIEVRDNSGRDVRTARTGVRSAAGPLLASSHSKTEPWTKGRIVVALMMESELPRSLAEDIAASVEARVFASGLRRISTSLLRELVDNELFSRGLAAHLQQQSVVGIPKHDLRDGLRHGFARQATNSLGGNTLLAWTESPEAMIARRVLEQFSLEDILSPEIADQHLGGAIHFLDLGAPQKDLDVPLSLRQAWNQCGDRSEFAFNAENIDDGVEFVRNVVARSARTPSGMATAATFLIVDLDAWMQQQYRGLRRARVQEFAARLVRSFRLANDPCSVGFLLDPESALFEVLTIELARSRQTTGTPRAGQVALHVDAAPSELIRVLQAIETLAVDHSETLVRLALPRVRVRRRGAPAAVRRSDDALVPMPHESDWADVATTNAAILNLPRAAYSVPPWNEGKLLERIVEQVDWAVEGLAQCNRFRMGLAASAASAAGSAGTRSAQRQYVLSWVGLRECVRYSQEGSIDLRLCREIVQSIAERARSVAQQKGIAVRVEPWYRSGARSQFERVDAERYPASSVFRDGERIVYSEGSTLSPVAGMGRFAAEAAVLAGLDAYTLPPFEQYEDLWDCVEALHTGHGAFGKAWNEGSALQAAQTLQFNSRNRKRDE
jgi:hypothetical protein